MIVTLAGHVDHGKTTLVRLLTGTDTDRLAEEKRRGLTIDLGFAYLTEAGITVGFVDVPGHHRFVHNMVAGVAATQHALLVVAADDGPMPQTREHLQILELLGVSSGVIALTKCDTAAPERIDQARREVRDLVAGSFLEGAPMIETASVSGAGIAALRAHLLGRAATPGAVDRGRPLRMPIDRVFTLRGAGLVATGTIHAGRVAVSDEVHLFPLGARARVRELRVQDRPAAAAEFGDRAAINLTGLTAAMPTRGHWLCGSPDSGHDRLVLTLTVLEDFPREIRHWSPVHVYHATSHATGRLALLDGSRLQPGHRGLVELVLDQPLLGKRGDRVVIRDQALERTIGGGSVIDNRSIGGRRRAPARLSGIRACAAPTVDAALTALLAQGPVDMVGFNGLWDLRADEFDALLLDQDVRRHEHWLIAARQWQQWRDALLDECRQRHEKDPTLPGLRENDFDAPVPPPFRTRVLSELAAAGELEQRAGRFSPPRHHSELSPAEQSLLERMSATLDQTQPPSLGDVARALHIPLDRLKTAIRGLVGKDALVQINDKRVYVPRRLRELAAIAEELAARGPFSVRDYRDAAGIGRNVAIDVLEFFDAHGFTRRHGESRTVTGDRSRLPATMR